MAAERKLQAIGINPESLAHRIVWLPTLPSTHCIRVAGLGFVVLVLWSWFCGVDLDQIQIFHSSGSRQAIGML